MTRSQASKSDAGRLGTSGGHRPLAAELLNHPDERPGRGGAISSIGCVGAGKANFTGIGSVIRF